MVQMAAMTLPSCSSPTWNVFPYEVGTRPRDLGNRANRCVEVFVELSRNSLWPEHVVHVGTGLCVCDEKLDGNANGKMRTGTQKLAPFMFIVSRVRVESPSFPLLKLLAL